jgi:RNA polymerase sigma factor (sigma-70 family)
MFARDPLAHPEPLLQQLYAYVAFRIGDGPDAEDVTSETLERALRYRASYDPRKGKPIAWLIGIARRCIDDFISANRTPPEPVPNTAAPGDLEAETVERLMLMSAVAGLDERDRELIALHYGVDLSPREIADLLGARTNTIEVALHRARARLRARLAADDEAATEALRRPAQAGR